MFPTITRIAIELKDGSRIEVDGLRWTVPALVDVERVWLLDGDGNDICWEAVDPLYEGHVLDFTGFRIELRPS